MIGREVVLRVLGTHLALDSMSSKRKEGYVAATLEIIQMLASTQVELTTDDDTVDDIVTKLLASGTIAVEERLWASAVLANVYEQSKEADMEIMLAIDAMAKAGIPAGSLQSMVEHLISCKVASVEQPEGVLPFRVTITGHASQYNVEVG